MLPFHQMSRIFCSFAKRESRRETLKVVSAYVKPQRSLDTPGKINLEKISKQCVQSISDRYEDFKTLFKTVYFFRRGSMN